MAVMILSMLLIGVATGRVAGPLQVARRHSPPARHQRFSILAIIRLINRSSPSCLHSRRPYPETERFIASSSEKLLYTDDRPAARGGGECYPPATIRS